MRRSSLLWFWILAFFLKAAGASWDASYHFKHLRELTQISHIVNIIGFILACILWLYMWRNAAANDRAALKISGWGFLIFFVAIPFDDLWHRTYGIDLTTWSPPHFALYLGTMIMLAGLIYQVQIDYWKNLISRGTKLTLQTLLVTFVMEDFWFPLLQQEQGVIALDLYIKGKTIASEDVLQFLTNPESQIYGGIPFWLYPMYSCFVITVVFTLAKRFLHYKFSATSVVASYLLFRTIADQIYAAAVYPQSTVPYFIFLSAILFDLFYDKTRHLAAYFVIPVPMYLYTMIETANPIHPPFPLWTLLPAFLIVGITAAAYNRVASKVELKRENLVPFNA